MKNQLLAQSFIELSTPLIADAAMRVKIPPRIAPPGIMPVIPRRRVPGRVLPAQHFGSVDVFLEAMQFGSAGDVLVIASGPQRLDSRNDAALTSARFGDYGDPNFHFIPRGETAAGPKAATPGRASKPSRRPRKARTKPRARKR